jgi:hypothetical protein
MTNPYLFIFKLTQRTTLCVKCQNVRVFQNRLNTTP